VYYAAKGLANPSSIRSISSSVPLLLVDGVLVEEIARTSRAHPGMYKTSVEDDISWLRHACTVYRCSTEQQMSSENTRILARTITAEMRQDGIRAQKDDYGAMESFLSMQATEQTPTTQELKALRVAFAKAYERYEFDFCWGRRLFVTKSGVPGLGPALMQTGDIVVILPGSPWPIILRPLDNEEYQLVGAAYAHGIMDGEAVSEHKVRGGHDQVFKLR